MGKMSLTQKKIAKLTKGPPGRYRDGGDGSVRGLLLVVTSGGASWILRYELHGRERWLGLGPVNLVSLKDARARAREARTPLA